MDIFGDEPRKPVRVHEVGQDLSLLSVAEFEERIGQLRDEIARLEADISAKSATKVAAEALFPALTAWRVAKASDFGRSFG